MGLKGSNTSQEALSYRERIHSYYTEDKSFLILLFFLIAVLIIGYFIPSFFFGRPFGTDTYTHIFHAQEMYATDSLYDFYEELGKKVLNPDLANNVFNYPFGSWLFIAILAKVTSLEPDTAAYLFSAIFLVIVGISYYLYAGLFLDTRTQKLFSLLFLFSMPNVVLVVNNFRPSTFVIPFLLFTIYTAYSEKIEYKKLIVMALSVFIIAITHTGSLIYLMIFSIGFFWIYCFIGRKFHTPLFILASSTFLFFWTAVKFFPHLYHQYATKATLFLTPGDFLAGRFHIFFADELSYTLYDNLFLNHQFVYVIICSAFVFAVGSVLVSVGDKLFQRFSRHEDERKYAILPTSGLSHSFLATPIWVGPIHTILGIIGFFRLDTKGKCFAITVVMTTVVPAVMQASEGFVGTTGALREISYLYLIVPVVAVLGLWQIVSAIHGKMRGGKILISLIYIVIFSVFIITPVIGNGYYLPSISGDDYVIEGMEWLSNTGDQNEKVAGYGYRTIPVYTGKMDASYGLASGTQTRTFIGLLEDIYFTKGGTQPGDLYSLFGAKYVLISDKLIENINSDAQEVVIDSHSDLDKIYSSRDFGIYAAMNPSGNLAEEYYGDDRVSIENIGSNIEIKTNTYKVIIDRKTPTIKYIGTTLQNTLEEGVMYDSVRITWSGNPDDIEAYAFNDEEFTREEAENQLIYRTILKGGRRNDNWSTVTIVYTFLPEMIKREFYISNDQLSTTDTPLMRAYFSTNIFMPASSLVLKKSFQRIEKEIYPSEDAVHLNDVYEDFYFSGGETGIYIKYDTTSPYPQYVTYKGSTAYDYSSLSASNFETVYPGATLHITQYISVGSEDLAERHIENENRVALHPYPDGIVPLVFCGYDSGGNTQRYGKIETFTLGNYSVEYTEVTGVLRLNYDLDEVLSDAKKNIPYVISISVTPPYNNILFNEGLRHPQMAQYLGEPTGTVILPESEPRTGRLSSTKSREEFFADWKNIIRSVYANDDMALFLIRTEDLTNPMYSQDFLNILGYAENYGLTISDPRQIATHFHNLQQIRYSSSLELDEGTVTVTNENDFPVEGVTFAVRMPVLDGDVYVTDNGEIQKTVRDFSDNILYISTDLGAQESKTISIRPKLAKKKLSVEIPGSLIEGTVIIVVLDEEGLPIKNAQIMIDDAPYRTNDFGNVSIELRRGSHEITIEKAGYEKETRNITVSSYVSFLEDAIDSVIPLWQQS